MPACTTISRALSQNCELKELLAELQSFLRLVQSLHALLAPREHTHPFWSALSRGAVHLT